METLRLEHVSKTYKAKKKKEKDVIAVNDFSLTCDDDEFIVFVGPSGCGKSTTLRMIAGLEDITSGDLYINGERVNDIEANYRDIAMVFQNYALYPHMTAYDNMAFGLKNRHVDKKEIDERIKAAAKILDIEELLNRKPGAMSGGQRQRVALGRAIVRRPKIFLLDEPLSNLDAKLRASMRVEISRLYEKLKTTFIYVTHDQVEAMTMGTRIVVMKSGVVQQIDTPTNLFDYPKNRFVAGFLGTPQMNFYEGIGKKDGDSFKFKMHGIELSYPIDELKEMHSSVLDGEEHKMIIGIRPDDVSFNDNGNINTVLVHSEVLGNETLLYTDFGNTVGENESPTALVIKSPERLNYVRDEILKVSFPANKIHFFENDELNEKSLMITPRSNLGEMRGYLSFDGVVYALTFENGLVLILDFIKKEVNPVYLKGSHRVTMKMNIDSAHIADDGDIEAIYEGDGIYRGKHLSRVELNTLLDYDASFDSSMTHLYVPYVDGIERGNKVKIKFDEDTLDFIGDDHISIFDMNVKEKKLDEYQVAEIID